MDRHHNNFDLLRLFAACQVMYVHASGWLKLPSGLPKLAFLYATPGVPIFFIISGFLVLDSALRSPTLIAFFRNRAFRIYPALFANIIGMEILIYFSGQLTGIQTPGKYLETLVVLIITASTTAAFWVSEIPNMYTFFSGVPGGFLVSYPSGVLWTLTVELSFYLTVPLFAAIAARSLRAGVAVLAATFVASAIYASYWDADMAARHGMLDVLCPQYLWIFAIGMIARLCWPHVKRMFEGTALIWIVVHLAFSFTVFGDNVAVDFHTGTNWGVVLRTVTLGCMVLSIAFTLRNASSILLRGIDISYGLYLWHMPVVIVLLSLGHTGHWWLWPIAIASAAVMAAASWLLIERPALQWKRRLGQLRRIEPAPAPLAG